VAGFMPAQGLRDFALNAVLCERACQSAVYESTARPLVADVLNGYNASVIVYGQTVSAWCLLIRGGEGGGAHHTLHYERFRHVGRGAWPGKRSPTKEGIARCIRRQRPSPLC
jgi:hypothetical protein